MQLFICNGTRTHRLMYAYTIKMVHACMLLIFNDYNVNEDDDYTDAANVYFHPFAVYVDLFVAHSFNRFTICGQSGSMLRFE